MASNVINIVSRQKKLESKRVLWENIWSDIARNMIPLMEDFLQTQKSGTRQGSEIYDGTGASALNIMIKGLNGKMVNAASTWFRLGFRTEELNEIPEVKVWLQNTERHLYNVFKDSNFYDSIESFLRDFAGFGTAVMAIEEDTGEGKLTYLAIDLSQCYIEQDAKGKVDTLHRKGNSWQAKQIAAFFGKDTPQIVKDALEKDPFKEFIILNAVTPREVKDPTKIGNDNMDFESVWILMGNSNNSQGDSTVNDSAGGKAFPSLIRESGYDRFPYIVGRWEHKSSEEYGRGPGVYALADVMGVNLMEKDLLQLSELAANPPMNVMDSMDGDVNFMPAGINILSNPDEGPHPTDIGTGGYPIGLDQLERKKEAIRKHFFVDSFQFLAAQPEGASITAAEVHAREAENAMILGPVIGKLSGVFDQIINVTFDKEYEAGRIDDPPAVVFEREGEKIDISYTGPLPQAQKAFFETSGVNRSIQSIADMAQLDPRVLKVPDFEEALRILLNANGWPQKATNTREEVKEQNEREKAIQEQAMQIEAGAAQAGTIKDLASADKDSGGKISEELEEQAV